MKFFSFLGELEFEEQFLKKKQRELYNSAALAEDSIDGNPEKFKCGIRAAAENICMLYIGAVKGEYTECGLFAAIPMVKSCRPDFAQSSYRMLQYIEKNTCMLTHVSEEIKCNLFEMLYQLTKELYYYFGGKTELIDNKYDVHVVEAQVKNRDCNSDIEKLFTVLAGVINRSEKYARATTAVRKHVCERITEIIDEIKHLVSKFEEDSIESRDSFVSCMNQLDVMMNAKLDTRQLEIAEEIESEVAYIEELQEAYLHKTMKLDDIYVKLFFLCEQAGGLDGRCREQQADIRFLTNKVSDGINRFIALNEFNANRYGDAGSKVFEDLGCYMQECGSLGNNVAKETSALVRKMEGEVIALHLSDNRHVQKSGESEEKDLDKHRGDGSGLNKNVKLFAIVGMAVLVCGILVILFVLFT